MAVQLDMMLKADCRVTNVNIDTENRVITLRGRIWVKCPAEARRIIKDRGVYETEFTYTFGLDETLSAPLEAAVAAMLISKDAS